MMPSPSNCDPTIELCEESVAIKASIGFKYNPHAEAIYALVGVTLIAYATFLAWPIDTSTEWGAAWFYNFSETLFTWGIEVLLFIVNLLFRSDGGTIDTLFAFWTRIVGLNVLFLYWVVDTVILLALLEYGLTAPSDKLSTWIKFGGLILLQAGATIVQMQLKESILFDVKWAKASPKVDDA